MTDDLTIGVRMYDVGFGDAFRVTVRRRDQLWTMLVDCGVHGSGASRDMTDSVEQIVAELPTKSPDDKPHLDVVVATHHHRDHISGFAEARWDDVTVGEVWLPFVADEADPDTIRLGGRSTLGTTAERLVEAIGPATRLANDPVLGLAQQLALNSSINDKAMDRLLGRNGKEFASTPLRRFLPNVDPEQNVIPIDTGLGITVHVLGPSRDAAMLKKMDPPKKAGWLRLDEPVDTVTGERPASKPPFAQSYSLPQEAFGAGASPALKALKRARDVMKLDELTNDGEALLAAATLLERAVNNTSLFFVLDVGGVSLLFPGDAQYGAWEHVRNDPAAKKLIDGVDFYKVGHHGSHNATPGKFATTEWAKHGDAMVPWGNVSIWADTIPWGPLMQELAQDGQRRVVLPREVRDAENRDASLGPKLSVDPNGGWWTELSYRVPS